MKWALKKKQIHCKYIEIIKDSSNGALRNVRTLGVDASAFLISVGFHQDSPLSLSHIHLNHGCTSYTCSG